MSQEKLQKDFIKAQKDLVELISKLRKERYLQVVDNKKKYLTMHFLGGMASGVGGAVGATIVVGLLLFVVSKLQLVPIIGNFVTGVIEVVNENFQYR